MPELARIDFAEPLNPGVLPLGQDRFLFDTRTGVRLWDASTAQWLPLKLDTPPAAGSLDRLKFGFDNLAPVRGGALLLGLSRDQRSASVWAWQGGTQSLAAALPLPAAPPKGWRLQALDAQHALVCHAGHGARVLRWAPGAPLRWAADGDAEARAALQGKGVTGAVQGFGPLALPAAAAQRPPVAYDTQRCAWELTQPPADLAPHLNRQVRGDRHPSFKPYFLNDGRLLVAELSYFDTVRTAWRHVAHPLMWDATARRWQPLAAYRSDAPTPHRSGQQEPVLAVGAGSALAEVLHLPTMTWRRYNEHLPNVWQSILEPLSSGQVLVIARSSEDKFRGVVGRITPSDGSVPAGRLHHGRTTLHQEVVAPGQHALLIGADGARQSDASEWVDLATAQSTELPRLPVGSIWPAHPTGLALADGSVVVVAGLPQGCAREGQFLPEGVCADRVGQPSWRYLPSARRWEALPALRIPYSRGPSWQWGNSDRSTQWPRVDLTQRASGELVWLQGGEFPDSRERELWPRSTALLAWSPQRPDQPPRRLAPLRKGRVSGSLVSLADGRLAVVGGDAQLDRVALEKRCADCPDEFVSIGPMRPARSTELLDETNPQAPQWVNGPLANFPGGQGFRLANGRVVKVSLREPMGENSVQAEVADAAFTQWTRLPLPPALPAAEGRAQADIRYVASMGNRVLVMSASDATLIWDDDRRQWRLHQGWPGKYEGSLPLSVTAGAEPGQVLVRYGRAVRLIDLPKP